MSEKFFQLVDIFGAANVGMVTGDSSVNPDAPIICCTAEILANLALRQGADAEVDQVVMDEFHYYGDPDRGWAWQVPLITLPRAQFVLMSATLGDVTAIADDLTRAPVARPRASPASTARCRCTSRTRRRPCRRPSRSCSRPAGARLHRALLAGRRDGAGAGAVVDPGRQRASSATRSPRRSAGSASRPASARRFAARARGHRRAPRRHAAALPPPRRDARPARAAARDLRHRHARRRHQRADPHGAHHRAVEVRRAADAAAQRPRVPPGRGRRAAPATTPPAPSWCSRPTTRSRTRPPSARPATTRRS